MLKGFIDSSLVLSVGGVKVVFDAVVRSTWEFFRDVCPLVSKPFMKIEYHPFFFLVYWILLYVRIKVVVPTKSVTLCITYRSLHCLPVRPAILCYSFSL